MIDCRDYRVSNLSPLRGQVLIEICEPPTSAGGIAFPETYQHQIDESQLSSGQPPPQEAIVRKIGAHDVALDFGPGDRVIVRRNSGRVVNQPPRQLKLVDSGDLLMVFV